ncbi:MAG: coenzyme F420-0:L-glutamate ligase, partial [Solirubrobacteraceae bacterium]
MITALPVDGLPEIGSGYDLATGVVSAMARLPAPAQIGPGDVLVIAHKAVSKSEGRVRSLATVTPGKRALELAAQLGKDPRHVQVVLDESREVVRAVGGVLVVETRHGYVCANAGVDRSNVPGGSEVSGDETVLMLPLDPDASARALRARFRELTGTAPGVIITDSFGRAWRVGQCDVAIGCAGV